MDSLALALLIALAILAVLSPVLGILWVRQTRAKALERVIHVLEALPDGAILLSETGRVLRINQHAQRLLQLEPHRHSDSLTVAIPALARLIQRANRLNPNMPYSNTITLFQHVLELDSCGIQGGGTLITLRDVTTNRKVEDALLLNERRFRSLFDNSNDAIMILELDGKISIANEATARLLGRELENILETNITQYVIPTEQESSLKKRESLKRGEAVPVYERTFVRPDASLVTVEINLVLVRDTDSTPMNIQVIARDVTDRRRQRAQLDAKLQQITSLQLVSDAFNSTLELNTVGNVALESLMRLSGADAGFIAITQGESINTIAVSGAYEGKWVGTPVNLVKGITGRSAINQQAEYIPDVQQDPDYYPDNPQTMALMAFPMVSREQLVGVVCLEAFKTSTFSLELFEFLRLVVDRAALAIDNAQLYEIIVKKLEELQHIYAEKDQLERFKTQMIELGAHQMKNAVMQLTGPLDIFELDKEQLGYPYDELTDIMIKAANRIKQIAVDIMSLERIERRYQGDYVRTYNLTEQVNEAYEAQRASAERKQLSFIFDDFPVFPLLINADDVQMYEAINNLIGNAIKYTPDGGRVELSLSVQEASVRFCVRDNGVGIPKERMGNLFQMFSRIKTPEVENIEGTGLGLFLVKSIVERFDGSVFVESEYGKGSSFGFLLPLYVG